VLAVVLVFGDQILPSATFVLAGDLPAQGVIAVFALAAVGKSAQVIALR